MSEANATMSAVLDLHDAGIRLWHQDDCIVSPGYVWFDEQRYHYGSPALHTARRQPRAVNTRFWWQLSTQALTPALGPARHSADLVHKHLQTLHHGAGEPHAVTLIAPGSMSREQLSLLLGIIGTLPFAIDAIVHRSALAAAAHSSQALTASGSGVHIELQLHQMLITETRWQDTAASVESSQALPGLGLIHLMDQLAGAIAEQFVLQTRFDPSRRAESEQTLYDALPALLADVHLKGETRLTIDGYQARIAAEHLQAIGRRLGHQITQQIASLVETADLTLLLDPVLMRIPGLVLAGHVIEVTPESLLTPISAHGEALRQAPEDLVFQTRVPISRSQQASGSATADSGAGVSAASIPARDTPQPPTHLLFGHTAQALGERITLDGGAELVLEQGVFSLRGDVALDLLVNGEPAHSGQLLAAGDQLTDSLGFAAQLIIVEH